MRTGEFMPDQPEVPTIIPVNAGHMLYRKCIVTGDDPVFIKAFDDQLFSDPSSREHSRLYLEKEYHTYAALKATDFPHLPQGVVYADEALYLSAHLPEHGWLWEAPLEDTTLQQRYIDDVLAALTTLEATRIPVLQTGRPDALDEFLKDGWAVLADEQVRRTINARLTEFHDEFHPHVQTGTAVIRALLAANASSPYEAAARRFHAAPRPATAHFDARQSNIAWHPDQGVSIVDWSWTSPAPARCDTTMFLIDLFKSGIQIDRRHAPLFDEDFAALVMGYWLARSAAPSASGDLTVRFHQLAAAASAATLLDQQQ